MHIHNDLGILRIILVLAEDSENHVACYFFPHRLLLAKNQSFTSFLCNEKSGKAGNNRKGDYLRFCYSSYPIFNKIVVPKIVFLLILPLLSFFY
tara:strand:+ start:4551 stop:4832 length:282 start_codon:yes stop_codon:yes gene_type:complete